MCMIEFLSKFDTILVDTCSVLHDKFGIFLEDLAENHVEQMPVLLVPQCVLTELSRFENEDSPRGERTRKAQDLLKTYEESGLLKILEHPESTFRPDEFFLSYAPHRQNEKILFITQDYALCRDLVAMNQSASCYGHPVCVKRLSFHATLQDFDMTQIPKTYTIVSDRTNAKAVFARLVG